jgi:DNA (cytosine-5)-methyltransferase 1
MKILNLYACLGGNRYKWNEVKEDIEVTAVELDIELARLYQERFPNDRVIVGDAHEYLLNNYKEFDFIWSSPPCPTHSKARGWNTKVETKYPDMKLYEEIILLETISKGEDARFKGKYVVENVVPYYTPLIPAQKRGRHLFWSNFIIPHYKERDVVINDYQIPQLEKHHKIDLSKYKGKQDKRKIGRNLVDYEAGKTIFETMLGIIKKEDIKQTELF